MRRLYDYICGELEKLEKKADRGDLSMSDIELGDTLAHFGKNLEKMMGEEEYSGRGRSYGRYSRAGMAGKLRELMDGAPDERTREELSRLADRM